MQCMIPANRYRRAPALPFGSSSCALLLPPPPPPLLLLLLLLPPPLPPLLLLLQTPPPLLLLLLLMLPPPPPPGPAAGTPAWLLGSSVCGGASGRSLRPHHRPGGAVRRRVPLFA
jgi:hypothetical protein